MRRHTIRNSLAVEQAGALEGPPGNLPELGSRDQP